MRLPTTLLISLALLAGCSTVDDGRAPVLAPNAPWALLPFANHTESPQAGLCARYAGDRFRVRVDGTLSGQDFTTDRTVNITRGEHEDMEKRGAWTAVVQPIRPVM